MADVLDPKQRSQRMSLIKWKDTKPEMVIRKYLFSKGLRYRLHNKKLPGKPDIVLKKYKTVVFINGCFWHGHKDCKYFKMPKSNEFFWEQKINRNRARDIANEFVLQTEGWKVIRIWECELKKVKDREITLEKLYQEITSQPSIKINPEEQKLIAAEPEMPYGE